MKYAACKKCARSVGRVNVVGNILMIALKGYLGVVGGSKALIADAVHSCADLVATIVMIIGLVISGREADEKYPYGYGKSEYVVAVLMYLFLFGIAVYIIWGGATAILEGHQIRPCLTAFWGALFSVAINELMFRQALCVGTQTNSPSIVAKAWESRSDVYSSIGVLIGILGAKMGFPFLDPLAAVAVGVVILKICIDMIKEGVLSLIDKAPEQHVLEEVSKLLGRVRGISKVVQIRAREIGRMLEFELELGVPQATTVSEGESIRREAKKAVQEQMGNDARVVVRLYPV